MLMQSTVIKLSMNGQNFAAAKDISSRVIWTNQFTARLFHYDNPLDFIGRRDNEIPLIADLAEQFIEDDNTAMSGKVQVFIERTRVRYLGDIEVLTTKIPIYDDSHQVSGTFYTAIPIKDTLFDQFFYQIGMDNTPNSPTRQIISVDTKRKLSIREMEVLFFTLRGKSAKVIARCLNISMRTAEAHLHNIKLKFGCHNKQQLIDCATSEGYVNLIPETLIQSEHLRYVQFLQES